MAGGSRSPLMRLLPGREPRADEALVLVHAPRVRSERGFSVRSVSSS
jgi:hypothetical protein